MEPQEKASQPQKDGTGSGLPASIEAAWGLRERPSKGPKRGLTLPRIVAAGVNIAATDGLAAVSMSRVAADLGVSTMSLYRYVAAKSELLLLMEDAALGAPEPGPGPATGWRESISHWAWAMRAALHRQPWVAHNPITAPPSTPNSVAWMERGLAALAGTGLDEGAKISVVLLVSGFVRNETALMASVMAATEAAGSTPDEMMQGWGRLLTRVTDAERFPAVTAALEAGVLDRADGPDDEFVFGLERILDGVQALIRRPTGG